MAYTSHRALWRASTALVVLSIIWMMRSYAAFADGFRIETKIYAGDEQPVSETTTLFLDGVVYDFIANPAQTAVFRKPGGGKDGLFILLENAIGVVFGTDTKVFPEPPAGVFLWGPVVVTGVQLAQVAALVVVGGAVFLYLTRTRLGKQAAAVAKRKRTGAKSPKTREELIRIARRRGLEGRSKMGRDELARALGEK